jgi:hypothetical protein
MADTKLMKQVRDYIERQEKDVGIRSSPRLSLEKRFKKLNAYRHPKLESVDIIQTIDAANILLSISRGVSSSADRKHTMRLRSHAR